MSYTVRLEPIGIEMEVEDGETLLQAAFRQGIMLMHGCKEGQCASCKSILLDGDIDLLRYSTFALPEYERDQDYILLCRTVAYSDLTVELLNYDEDILKLAIPVKDFAGTVSQIEPLTHDIRRLCVHLAEEPGLKFFAGQYVDLSLTQYGITRSYSMASTPSSPRELEFIIKVYPDGAFSSLLDTALKPGDPVRVTGPYGICCRRTNDGPLVLVGGGSGMAPLLSILRDLVEHQEDRPVRFFYGGRTANDLFYVDEIQELGRRLTDFEWIPGLSHLHEPHNWTGEPGFIHEVVQRRLDPVWATNADAHVCGPPPLIDAVIPVLRMKGVDVERIYFDKFYAAAPIETPTKTKE
ncbi:aromatic/alkene monooxygenase subunit gamma [Sulfobacillus acidophilus TPY]|uniref:Phenol 2-monooxygenase n=1 Tax=Sulfobacillus acidophilus (strain ATCC 700253 / DSM 10332 / NAL) TaxID=679936 RepID=G8TZI8_SULAD|nr:aromatic/alkene monooxygenase subunit gamma [Sulfobacillus acidophilus TPY]AEW05228.1 Phenol 2-monooxygenase [Sulfobacillus acidophilus DSM 10332]